MKRSVLEIISKTLQIALQAPQLQSEEEKGVRPEREVGPQSAIMKLLQTLARASADIVEVCARVSFQMTIEYLSMI